MDINIRESFKTEILKDMEYIFFQMATFIRGILKTENLMGRENISFTILKKVKKVIG